MPESQYLKPVHVDIVCSFRGKPVWFLVSDRNPNFITWVGHRGKEGLRAKVVRILSVARSSMCLKPDSVALFFSKGISDRVFEKLSNEFRALELNPAFEEPKSQRVYVLGAGCRIFEIKIEGDRCVSGGGPVVKLVGCEGIGGGVNSSGDFRHLLSSLEGALKDESNKLLINFDTTALIAIISGISNGGIDQMLKNSDADLRTQFKGNYEFVLAQATSEKQDPILPEINGLIIGKKGIICESVLFEFKELVSMYGGMNEKARADRLLTALQVVEDNASERVSALPTTRKIALKNKIIFGTGDRWGAPTLSANEGFMRAISQTGMSLLSTKHRPRALIGD